MELQYLKAVHIIFVVTWFAGLFYLPRLMIYSAEADQLPDPVEKKVLITQYQLMKKRLLYGITWPSAVITLLLGARMLMLYPLTEWLKIKLVLVVVLLAYHLSLQFLFRQQEKLIFRYSGDQLRVWNEVPTVLLFAIVFLVVFKNTADIWWGLAALFILITLLVIGIRIYKYYRGKMNT